MKKSILLFILVFSFSHLITMANSSERLKYSQVKIFFENQEQINDLVKAGLVLDHVHQSKEDGRLFSYTTVLDNNELEILQQSNLDYSIAVQDVVADYKARQKENSFNKNILNANDPLVGFELGSMGGYYTYAEVIAELDSMHIQYPNLVTRKDSIGASNEGRAIWLIKISDNPDLDEDEPEVLYTALHHAREPAGMMAVIYFMYHLLENYGIDPEATYLINNREFYFVPVINPDGYEYNRMMEPNGGYLWRKNKHDNNEDGKFNEDNDGVDLNRNYGYEWGYDNNGSSPFQGSGVYRGSGPFSEPETQAIRNLCEARDFRIALNYHTYSNLLIYPWGYIASFETPDSIVFRQFATDMTQFNNYVYGTGDQTVGYLVNGDSDDWMYGEQATKNKIFAMTPEVGNASDGFWADISRIYPLVQENLYPNLFAAWAAGAVLRLDDYYLGDESGDGNFEANEEFGLTVDLKNIGLGNIAYNDLDWRYLYNDPYLKLAGYDLVGVEDTLFSQEVFRSNNTWYQIDSLAPTGHVIEMQLEITQYGIKSIHPLTEIIVGKPDAIFTDNLEQQTENWAAEGNWERYSGKSKSGNFSYTDSPSGDYTNDLNASLYIDLPISIPETANAAYLEFYTRWEIEAGWDFARVQISENAKDWISLSGKFTKSGSGRGAQDNGPGYDGTRLKWVKEQINLNSYIGKDDLYFRFKLQTDEGVTADGWYIDDVKISIYKDSTVSSVERSEQGPASYQLYQNFPNPFNPNTTIRFDLAKAADVEITIYDISGKRIITLLDEFKPAGTTRISWDGKNDSGNIVASGVYFYSIKSAQFSARKKLLLLR